MSSLSVPSTRTRRAVRLGLVPLALVSLGLGAAACGSSSTSTSSPSTTAAAGSSTTAGGSTGTTASAGTGTAKKVSANTASKAELEAALTAAGVQNAAKWANEIEEYRPYPTDDPKLTQLRKELAKYKPSADQLDKILSVLEP